MSSSSRWIAVLCLTLVCALLAHSQKLVRQITIRSAWGGFGPHADTTTVITQDKNGYVRNNQPVAQALIDALVNALQAPLIPKPDAVSLGVTQDWLNAHAASQKPQSYGDREEPTAGQRALFRKTFTGIELIKRLLPELFQNWHTDDNPGARVEVEFEDNTKLSAYSNSQFAYMLPWCVGLEKKTSYNPAISRAVAALLPPKTVNKERLADADLAAELAEAVMSEIQTAYDLRGAEDRVGPDLARLRTKYTVTTATIDPYIRPEYGPDNYDAKHEEVNLHATLHKTALPENVVDEVTLQRVNGHIQGIDEFLNDAHKYEDLVLSVPWLRQYILAHPKTQVRITYVHNASLGDDATRRFAADMRVRERSELALKVKAQQKQIALIQIGVKYTESYWLIFPDRHLLLWRYEGPSGLLNFKPSDFGEGECAGLGINDGGCSGREVAPHGKLVPQGTPRDVACVQKWRAQHPLPTSPPDALFQIAEHDREGFIDRTGAIAIPLCFEGVQDFSEGLAPFERDGRWGYIDSSGKVIIEPTFPWAEEFHEGLAHAQIIGSTLGIDGRWGYIDKSGVVVIPPTYERMMSDSEGDESAFHEGLAMVEIWDDRIPPRKGFIDRTGKLVIPARFTYVYPFSEGLAAATETHHGDSGWGFIDKTGQWVVPPQFDWASNFTLGLAPVKRKQDCAYIDKTGAPILKLDSPPPPNDCASAWGDFTDGLSRWRFGSRYSFIDRTGKTVIPAQFDHTFGFSEGLAAVQIGKKWGFINTTGKMIIPLQNFDDAKPFHNGLARVGVEDRGVGYIDHTGKFVWGPRKPSNK